MELVKSLGASKTIDYTKEDFTKNEETYNVIFDAVRKLKSSTCQNSLKKDGSFLSVKSSTKELKDDLVFLKELVEAGRIKAVIDRRYSLEQTAEAHRYVEGGHKRGNVVITM